MDIKIMSFAIEAHQNANHLYDGKPYSVHLVLVNYYAIKYIDCIPNDSQEDVISACWLHDTIEDCRLTYNDIKGVSNKLVADIVYAVTNEKGKTRKERANDVYYEGIRNTLWAKYVKLCDRLANVKYSHDTNSRMFLMYRKEHKEFIEKLFPDKSSSYHYRDMIEELNYVLSLKETSNTLFPVTH